MPFPQDKIVKWTESVTGQVWSGLWEETALDGRGKISCYGAGKGHGHRDSGLCCEVAVPFRTSGY